ncbi:MAG: SUMF1/EgtB/PvdO family nonheme iron enzyme [Nocardiopsaceae bacterium]|nr:SUMF1/EgtB/PvdO family nonheme iron enzyme [Nocardiopsaceae bacterium]
MAGSTTRPRRGRLFPPAGPRVSGSGPSGLAGSVPAVWVTDTLPSACLEWLQVDGGTLPASRWRAAVPIRDLAWSATPVTADDARQLGLDITGDPFAPLTGLDLPTAATVAAALGGRLPTSAEWEWMAGQGKRRYPWGDDEPTRDHANLRGLGPGHATRAGAYPAGATPAGILDVAGNVWEWTSTRVAGGGATVRGGSWNSISLYAQCGFTSEIPAATASPGIGMRVVRP